jgi:hypothetical protein
MEFIIIWEQLYTHTKLINTLVETKVIDYNIGTWNEIEFSDTDFFLGLKYKYIIEIQITGNSAARFLCARIYRITYTVQFKVCTTSKWKLLL